MKQFTFSAQVANNLLTVLQGYSKTIRLLLVILTMFVLSIGQMYGYTITFNGSANESTSLSTSTTAASITGNSPYVTGNLVTATKVYGATSNGVKLGASSNAGTIKFNLSTTGKVTPTSIVVNCKLYNSSKSATLKVNGSATQNVPSSSGNLTFAITSPITYIELASSKYIWIKSVTVNTAAGSTTYKVTYDKNGATSGSVPTDATSYNSGATVTVKSNSGNLAKTGYTFGGWNTNSSGTGTNYTAGSGTFKITGNTTLYAKWNLAAKYTVTLNAGPGTCAASVTEPSAGAGVTLPTPTLDGCDEWSFAGWKTNSAVTTETTTEPTLIPAGNYKPSNNITLYAVYQRTETTSGGGGTENETYAHSITSKTWSENGAQTLNSISWTLNNNGSYYGYDPTKGQQIGSGSSPATSMTLTTSGFASATKITAVRISTSGASSISGTVSVKVGSTAYTSGGSTTKSLTTTNTEYEFTGSSTGNVTITWTQTSSKAIYFKTIEVDYQTTGGSSTTTYYHSTPDCGSTEPTYTLTLHSGLSCVTDGSATVELNATELTNFIAATRDGFTCSGYWSAPSGGVQVLNADGTFAATSVQDYITDGKWTNEGNVTLTPHWECSNTMTLSVGTQSGGTYSLSKTSLETCDCTDNKRQVTITATPNSGYSVTDISYSGNGTATKVSGPTVNGNNTEWVYQFNQGDNGNGTFTVTFTTIPTYTVTWNNNGDTTSKNYNHGETLEVPTAPASCDGVKEFVGWTAQGGYANTTAPADLFTESSGTVTADATYYAVYAEGSGGGGTGWTAVTSTSDLEAGATYAISNAATGGTYLSTYTGGNNFPGSTSIICPLILGGSAGAWTFQIADGGTYNDRFLTATSTTSSNYLKAVTTADDYSVFSISFDAINKNAVITCTGKASRNILRYNANSGSPIFACYTSGQSSVYLQKLTGGGGYTNYTTSCATITDIRIEGETTIFNQFDPFEFGGTVYAIDDEDNETDVTELATFTGYDMSQVGEQTVTVTYLGRQATYTITVNEVETWHITWNVSGATNTGIGPRYVAKGKTIGECSRTGDIQIPAVPTGCTGKTFIGWTESNTVPEDGVGITYINKDTKPDSDKTYYAVFATVHNVCTRQAIEDIADGSKVVIVAGASVSGASGKAISSRATTDTYNLAGDEVTINGNQITTPHVTCLWIINKVSEGVYRFEQNGKYLNGIIDGTYSNLKYLETKDSWNVTAMSGKFQTYTMESKNAEGEYIEWYNEKFTIHNEVNTNGEFDMQFYLPADLGSGSHGEDYTTGCHECTITYYGFSGGYSTQCGDDDLNSFTLPVNSAHTIPNCGTITDPSDLKREFLGIWNTKPHGGKEFKPGDTFILTQDTTFYAQWKLETDGDITLPTNLEDLAGTDIYVYGGTTLNIQPGTTTINSLTLKGGIQADGSYKMPTVWVPEGATLVRNSNKINLDLIVNAKTYYPFAVPFATKNDQYIDYLDPDLNAASTYGTHFVIKTYDGARRATQGEDRANNWVKVLRHTGGTTSYLEPGVGYIITALTYPDKDTATIRIPMTVPNTWFQNGEQAAVSTTVRNTIAVTAHGGTAANEHQRHAGWNFVANPYLTSFAGGNVANDGDLAYINGELIIEGSYEYTDEEVPYVTVPAYDFAYYSQHKLSEVKLSPEWSFFVQVGTGGTMNFTTAGRQQAPASIAARNAEERPVKMDVDLILSDNHNSDQTGIIICDRYTDAYEIGRDLEKLFGSAYNLSVYTLMEDNTPLAFQALAIRSSMQVIPVGYRTPEQGEYTFRLNEATSSIDLLNEQYEQLVLVDYQTGELTNLLYTDYTFYSERTQSNSRFAIYAVPRQNAPTDLPNAIGSDEEVRKVIYNDHLYILRDGNVYNGMGQKM